jgi:tRNA threonylcarbamoyladenosine biosynthesis protein TsaB
VVSRGPGSYTGLRVDVMSAKAFAYATGCALLAIDTFAAVALQAPAEAGRLDVLADAQQDKVYVQSLERRGEVWSARTELVIVPFARWQTERDPDAWVSGPGLRKWQAKLSPGVCAADASQWEPRADSLLQLGLRRFLAGERDDVWTLEPLYLRPSSAEEQWRGRHQ